MPELNAEQKLRYIAEALKNTGDLLFLNAQGNPTRLGIGSSGQSLIVSGGVPAWGDASTSYVYSNNDYLQWRNAANSADINVLRINTSDQTEIHCAAGTEIGLFIDTNKVWSVNSSGQLVQDSTNGGDLVFGKAAGIIRQSTTDGADNKRLVIHSSGATGGSAATRGASLQLAGNEHSNNGSAFLQSGDNANAAIALILGNSAGNGEIRFAKDDDSSHILWKISADGTLNQDSTYGGDIVFGKTTGYIRQSTSDGADNKAIVVTGGGASAGDVARGGYVQVSGNEETGAGTVLMRPGNNSGGRVQAYLSAASQLFQVLSDAGTPLLQVQNDGKYYIYRTITAGGTTGNQTINRPAGSVNFAAGASTLTVTNSLVDTNSVVIATVLTNDTTAIIKNVVCSAGSFVIRLNAAATAETKVGFLVLN